MTRQSQQNKNQDANHIHKNKESKQSKNHNPFQLAVENKQNNKNPFQLAVENKQNNKNPFQLALDSAKQQNHNPYQLALNSVKAKNTPSNLSIQKKQNNTGLPDQLKTGVENLSGYAMDDVKVHYNSDQPAQLNAHAFAQGADIHIAPGQERHLPHEAWHVVQQKQGRVKPTLQMKQKINVNDDPALELEADTMGAKALAMPEARTPTKATALTPNPSISTIQRKGERTAVMSTHASITGKDQAIRRGNRRASIDATDFESGIKKDFIYYRIYKIIDFLYKKLRKRFPSFNRRKFNKNMKNFLYDKIEYIKAIALKKFAAGNCNEFSDIVYAHLVQNTTDQYVYKAMLMGKKLDHAFVFTSEENIEIIPYETTITKIRDRNKATIADAWDGYQVMTLQQFLDKGNYYKVQLTDENVVILKKTQAIGEEIINDQIKAYITEWVEQLNEEFEAYKGSKKYQDKKEKLESSIDKAFTPEGSNIEEINDRRSLTQKLENSTLDEKADILDKTSETDLLIFIRQLTPGDKSNQTLRSVVNLLEPQKLERIYGSCSNEDKKRIRLARSE